jgi:hypothetical protein
MDATKGQHTKQDLCTKEACVQLEILGWTSSNGGLLTDWLIGDSQYALESLHHTSNHLMFVDWMAATHYQEAPPGS